MRNRAQTRLDVFRVDVFATGRDHDVLGAAHQGQPPTTVQLAEVSGVEPAFLVDGFPGGRFVVGIADHDVRTACQDFTDTVRVGTLDADLHANHRLAHAARARLRSPL